MMNKKEIGILVLILIISAFLRFYNLMHDSPYFFNPDERNMAGSISQLRLPSKTSEIIPCLISQFALQQSTINNCNLNPHFFSYGQFPLYLAFFSDQIAQSFWQVPTLVGTRPESHWDPGQARMTTFPSAIFWLRFWSALFSILTVLLVYLLSRFLIHNSKFSILAALMAAFTPGLIQSAHFGTTESLLTLFFLLSIYLSFKLFDNPIESNFKKYLILLSLVIGFAAGSKLTGLFFLTPPLFTLLIQLVKVVKKRKRKWVIGLLGYLKIGLFLTLGSLFFFIVSSPYNLIEPENFKSAVFGYEADVATGRYTAFYTRQFVDTTPILFQAEKIFPYALGWPVFILGSLGFLSISINILSNISLFIFQGIRYQVLGIRKRRQELNLNTYYLILTTSFLIYLLPNTFLFAKWTRFMTPLFPFFAIFAGYLFSVILGNSTKWGDSRIPLKTEDSGQARMTKKLVYWFIGLLIITSILPGLMFMSIYTYEDSRVSASRFIYTNIPNNSYVLSETANVIDIPVGIPDYEPAKKWNNVSVISFDFYHMDENPLLFNELINHLEKADYIFIPSRRIFANYLRLPTTYPKVAKYYQLLFSGRLGFAKVAEISSFPQLTIRQLTDLQLTIPDENAEETWTVFDHPVVRIYRKVKPLTINQYMSLFGI